MLPVETPRIQWAHMSWRDLGYAVHWHLRMSVEAQIKHQRPASPKAISALPGVADRYDAPWKIRPADTRRRIRRLGAASAAVAGRRPAGRPVPPAAAPPPPPQPTWRPPADRGGSASLIFGVIILVIGLWFFATKTLGLDLPDIEWGTLWPLLLIGLGAWIVFGAMRRNR